MLPQLLIVVLLICLRSSPSTAAEIDDAPRFFSVAPSDIPSGVISALSVDQQGYLWLGTPAGAVRYDGYRFRLYGNHWSTPGTLSTVFVRSLLTSADGTLWVGSDFSGLLRHDPQSGTLQRVALRSATQQPLSVNALAADPDGSLWAGSDGDGLFRRSADGQLRQWRAEDGDGLPDDRIGSLQVDKAGTLWVGSWKGLASRAASDEGFEQVPLPLPDEDRRITALLEDSHRQIWIGTHAGRLLRRHPDGRIDVLPQAADAVPVSVHDLLQLDDDTLWVARGDGIEVRDTHTGAVRRLLRHDPDFPQGLAGNEVRALLRDRGGQVWVAGYGGGLQRHDPHNIAFDLLDRHSEVGRLLGDPNIRSVLALRDGRWLLGTQDRGIALLDAALRPISLLRDAQGTVQFDGVRIAGMAEATDGSWWIGSDAGVFRRSPEQPALEAVALAPGRVRRMLAGPRGDVWIATESGLYRGHSGAEEALPLRTTEGAALDDDVNGLAIDTDGNLWIGGGQGLAVLGPGDQTASWVPPQHAARNENPDVLGLLAGADGALWFDTPAGLYLRHRNPDGEVSVRAVSAELGAGGRPFGANLLADAEGRIWTQHRLYDPAGPRIVSLSQADGIDIGSAWFRAYDRGKDGRLLFGGSKGALVVQPQRYRFPDYDAPLVITELRVDDQWRSWSEDDWFHLWPGERRLTAEFAALDYSAPGELRYRHRVQGEHADWRESDADYRVATLANLAPGDYRLEVQASDRHGRWTSSQLVLPVRVHPAWWQHRAFHLMLLAAALLAVHLLVRQRTRWLRRRRAELERRVQARTEELQMLSAALKQKSDALEQASLTDPLTGLRNRRYFAAQIDEDVSRSRRRHRDALTRGETPRNADLVFFLVDLDHFKRVNDEFGHAAGDAVLIQMRERLQACFRDTDHLVRWGGEEFLVVSRDTDRQRAEELAGRAVRAVSDFAFELPGPRRLRCTCSVGYAALPLQPGHPEAHGWAEAVELADLALYAVKHAGRNGWVGIEIDAPHALGAESLRDPAVLMESGLLRLRSPIDAATVRAAIIAASAGAAGD
jgi:diguanylate cyclase (GGDEF)-like protein